VLGASMRVKGEQRVRLHPDTAAAGVDPRPAGRSSCVESPAHDGGIAVGGQRDREALFGT